MLKDVSFANARITGADLTAADLRSADFDDADVTGASFHLAKVTQQQLEKARGGGHAVAALRARAGRDEARLDRVDQIMRDNFAGTGHQSVRRVA